MHSKLLTCSSLSLRWLTDASGHPRATDSPHIEGVVGVRVQAFHRESLISGIGGSR